MLVSPIFAVDGVRFSIGEASNFQLEGRGLAVSFLEPGAVKRVVSQHQYADIHCITFFSLECCQCPWVQTSSVLYPHQRELKKLYDSIGNGQCCPALPPSSILGFHSLGFVKSVTTCACAFRAPKCCICQPLLSSALFVGLCLFKPFIVVSEGLEVTTIKWDVPHLLLLLCP